MPRVRLATSSLQLGCSSLQAQCSSGGLCAAHSRRTCVAYRGSPRAHGCCIAWYCLRCKPSCPDSRNAKRTTHCSTVTLHCHPSRAACLVTCCACCIHSPASRCDADFVLEKDSLEAHDESRGACHATQGIHKACNKQAHIARDCSVMLFRICGMYVCILIVPMFGRPWEQRQCLCRMSPSQ